MMISVIELLEKNTTEYTSVKYLANTLKDMGYPMHKKKFSPYMNNLIELGIVEKTELYHKPYKIKASKQELNNVKKTLIMLCKTGGMPEMVLEYILKQNGITPFEDVDIIDNIQFGSTSGAFAGGQGDYTVEFEPTASTLESGNYGYVVASLGTDSGKVPYTVYMATKDFIAKNPDTIQKFTNAIYKAQLWTESHTALEIAEVIAPHFKENTVEEIEKIVDRYKTQETWALTPIFEKESLDLIENILKVSNQLSASVPYEKFINTDFANQSVKNIKN